MSLSTTKRRQARIAAVAVVGALLALAAVGSGSAQNPGSRIAFNWPGGIFTMNPYDPESIALLIPDRYLFRATWSPVGDRLAAFRYTGPTYELVLFDDVGRELETLITGANGGYIAWSPDGREIAYTFGEQTAGDRTTSLDDDVWISTIRAVDVVTHDTRTVTTVGTWGPKRVGTSIGGLQISWSPDGSEIAYTRKIHYKCGDELQYTCFDNDIMVVDAQGGTGSALTSDAHSESPDFSPDGQLIVFRQQGISPFGGLFVMSRTGGSKKMLVGTDDLTGFAFQRFSPDSEQVLFTTQKLGATDFNTDLFLVDVAGGTPYQVTRTTNDDVEPSWAPPPFGCTVKITFRIGTSTPLSSLDFGVQYGDAPGAFVGSSEGVQCEELNLVEGVEASFSDLEDSSTLTLSLDALSQTPIQGPKDFARCTWVPTSRLPTEDDFDLSTSTAVTFANSDHVDPQASISAIECAGPGDVIFAHGFESN